jgi:hypothetical protein
MKYCAKDVQHVILLKHLEFFTAAAVVVVFLFMTTIVHGLEHALAKGTISSFFVIVLLPKSMPF